MLFQLCINTFAHENIGTYKMLVLFSTTVLQYFETILILAYIMEPNNLDNIYVKMMFFKVPSFI